MGPERDRRKGKNVHGNAKGGPARRKVRYAVVGLGYMSQAAVLPAFAHARGNSELAALVSGDREKAERLARKYNVRRVYRYEEYEDCLRSGEIDAVYLGLPKQLHCEYSEAAARAGVHILCEKPMAGNEQECEAMIEAAARHQVKLMIAYRAHFEEGNLSAAEAAQEGKIGEPRIFRSIFSRQGRPGDMRLEKKEGGDPIRDLGVYCINAARSVFRSEPYEVFAYNATGQGERFGKAPEMTAAILRFPGDRLATFECGFGAADRSSYEVVGTRGVVKMDPAYEMAEDLRSEITVEGRTRISTFRKRGQVGAELVYFSDCVLNDKDPEPDGEEGLADVRVIEALVESACLERPVAIPAVAQRRRLTADEEWQRPSSEKAKLVYAESASR